MITLQNLAKLDKLVKLALGVKPEGHIVMQSTSS